MKLLRNLAWAIDLRFPYRDTGRLRVVLLGPGAAGFETRRQAATFLREKKATEANRPDLHYWRRARVVRVAVEVHVVS